MQEAIMIVRLATIRTAALAIVLTLALVTGLSPATAQELGTRIGAKVPDIGTPLDQKGMPRSLSSLMGANGLVLFFVRSADWCPYCIAQMMDLNTSLAAIERRGYKMASISYDSPQVLSTFMERRGINYTMLSDPKSEIIDRYNLRDPQYQPGSPAYGVPRPIIFILDKSGTVKAKLYEESYRQRPPSSLVVTTLDKVSAGTN
jgi:peroxiredoxin